MGKYLYTRSFAGKSPDGGKLSLNPNEVEAVRSGTYGSTITMKSGQLHYVVESIEEVEKYVKSALLPLDFSV